MDERQGTWTRIVDHGDSVEFRQAGSAIAGKGVAVLFAFVIALLFFPNVAQATTPLAVFVALFLAAVVARLIWSACKPHKSLFVFDTAAATVTDTNSQPAETVRWISARDIRHVVVRENTGREYDDFALAQVYVAIRGVDAGLLLYQQPISRYDRVVAIGRALACRWQKPCRVEKRHQKDNP